MKTFAFVVTALACLPAVWIGYRLAEANRPPVLELRDACRTPEAGKVLLIIVTSEAKATCRTVTGRSV